MCGLVVRLTVLLVGLALLQECAALEPFAQSGTNIQLPEKPNIIVIYGDDVGYGDLNSYGHPTSRTPSLDQMAEEGMKITQFYSAAPLCSPSRASLMTGRLFPRTGVYSRNNTKFPTGSATFTSASNAGMLLSEVTLPQYLKEYGYVSGMAGKWHLGVKAEYLPINRGFDSYFGCPLTPIGCNSTAYNGTEHTGFCMLFNNHTIVEQPTDIRNVDARYVQNTKDFITANAHQPFFFYFSSHHTHMPQFASDQYLNTTERGLFGDSLAELDDSVGAILEHVKSQGIANRTLVIFSADNGPALISKELGGEQGPLKCGKGTTYEGGVREPAIFWWPGVIQAGRLSYAMASTLDIFPTAVSLAGGKMPSNRTMDGVDLTHLLTGQIENGPRVSNFYYSGHVLMAVRLHQFKVHFATMGSHCLPSYPDKDCHNNATLQYHDPPLLFNVQQDPKERYPLNIKQHQEPLHNIVALVAKHNETMTFGPSQVDQGNNPVNFPCCDPTCTPKSTCCRCPSTRSDTNSPSSDTNRQQHVV